ncbi:hypothetical protein O3M35_000140 [Rhynocoris fuscipes]|uniref:Uncharacterized protein n=1 Tax=Rhynocoris fuscipes TaxID=488301 RepID=A0AAW1DKN7_9HEMI
MDSNSDDECKALPYDTPSPYKQRRPEGLPSKARIDEFKKLNERLEELEAIERKYRDRLLANNTDQSAKLEQVEVEGFILLTELSNIRTKICFHPDYYFNKFNLDSLEPCEFLRNTCYRDMSLAECLLLISSNALEIPDDPIGKEKTIKFLFYLGSVTDDIVLAKKISLILSGYQVNFADFLEIIENWGRIDRFVTAKKTNNSPPNSHNFTFVLDLIASSLEKYSLIEIKEIFKFLNDIILDPVVDSSSLVNTFITPARICIQQFQQHQISNEEIIKIIYDDEWNICQVYEIIRLLLYCGVDAEICLTLATKILANYLSNSPLKSDQTISMDTFIQILLDGKRKLYTLSFPSLCHICLLIELIVFRMANRMQFNISPLIDLLEKLNKNFDPLKYSTTLISILVRLKTLS